MTVWRSDPSVPAVLAVLSLPFFPVLQIQTILILIRIRLSNLIPIRILTYKVLSCTYRYITDIGAGVVFRSRPGRICEESHGVADVRYRYLVGIP